MEQKAPRPQGKLTWGLRVVVCAFLILALSKLQSFLPARIFTGQPLLNDVLTNDFTNDLLCPQELALHPVVHRSLDKYLDKLYRTDEFKLGAYDILSGAVRISCESYDDLLPVGKDPRWNVFQDLHEYLEKAFPLIYKTLTVTKVNTYAIVYHWQGSDSSLKPLLLAAHQDVVPVEEITLNQWKHPPYSGHFDGTWIWGRGSADDKADLISQMLALENLIECGFSPKRTIVLAVGIDEESSGLEGAGKLAVYLESTYGTYGFGMLVDEGEGYGENAKDELIFAVPGISEKGYMDVKVEVFTPGGHSSVPPPHTSIGILSLMVTEIERHPHELRFTRNSTAYANAQCRVKYQTNVSRALKEIAYKSQFDDEALCSFQHRIDTLHPLLRVMTQTTQAVDLFNAGVKINALPEVATTLINHRIAEHSSSHKIQEHIAAVALPVAMEFNLSVAAFGKQVFSPKQEMGQLVLSDALYSALEPSPVTPISLNGPYGILSGTIKATLETSERYEASGVVVAPSLGLGNTDTRFYWNLTRHIFRYSHRGDTDDLFNGLHTVNEAVRGQSIIEQIRFFTKLILNSDEHEYLF